MVAARRSSSSGASLQKQEKAPLKKKRGNSAKAGFVSLVNSWARNEATDMSMSVSTACQLLQDKLGNPLFYDEQPTVKSGPVGVPKLLELIICSSRAAKFVLCGCPGAGSSSTGATASTRVHLLVFSRALGPTNPRFPRRQRALLPRVGHRGRAGVGLAARDVALKKPGRAGPADAVGPVLHDRPRRARRGVLFVFYGPFRSPFRFFREITLLCVFTLDVSLVQRLCANLCARIRMF